MPFYLTRFSYTPATWAKLIKNPEDRRAAAKQYIEAVGGKAAWVLVCLRRSRRLQLVGGAGQRLDGSHGDRDQRWRSAELHRDNGLADR